MSAPSRRAFLSALVGGVLIQGCNHRSPNKASKFTPRPDFSFYGRVHYHLALELAAFKKDLEVAINTAMFHWSTSYYGRNGWSGAQVSAARGNRHVYVHKAPFLRDQDGYQVQGYTELGERVLHVTAGAELEIRRLYRTLVESYFPAVLPDGTTNPESWKNIATVWLGSIEQAVWDDIRRLRAP